MVKKVQIQPKPAEISPEKIRNGIIKLTRRIEELRGFDIATIQERWDPKTDALVLKINDTIAEIYGYGTVEFKEYSISTLDALPVIMGGGRDPLCKVKESYKKSIESAIVKLSSLKETLEEKIRDIESDAGRQTLPIDFWSDIHPKITALAKTRFENKHYADAVESALKEINSCVKDIFRRKTSRELDGASLMYEAFSPKNPIIVIGDLSTASGRDMQQGYMEIFAGVMIGIRNPKAHDNTDIAENRAKHFIYFASLLMYKIDERI